MTSLLISYPHIPFSGSVLASPTAATGYPATNVITGPRAATYKRSTAGTSSVWDFDFGSTIKPDHLIIARANLLRCKDSAAVAWKVDGASDSGFTAPETKSGTFNLGDLLGPQLQDFITTFTFATAFRYFRITITTTASFQHELSKLYLGAWFDLQRDPIWGRQLSRESSGPMARLPAYDITLNWEGITDTTRASFISSIGEYRENPIFVYTTTYHDILNEHRLIHCAIKSYEFTPRTNNNNSLTMRLEELI